MTTTESRTDHTGAMDTRAEGDAPVSWSAFLGSSHAASLALVCLAVWLHAADSLVVATMLPAMIAEVGGAGLVAWNVALYLTASIIAGAASALLTIRYGLRVPMSAAAAVFGAGCLISAIAPSMPVILGGRVLQGLGGGALVSMGFIATQMLFPSGAIPRAMAAISTLWGVSSLLGPLIGGLFVEYATWRWGFVFFAGQAFALAGWIALRQMKAVTPDDTAPTSLPWGRLGVICLGLLLVTSAGIDVAPVRSGVFVALGLVCFATFLRLDDRAGVSRMLPCAPFDPRTPTGSALLMVLCMCMATITMTVFGTLLLTRTHGISALMAGCVLAASALGWSGAAFIVSGSPERSDGLMIGWGMGVVTASLAGLALAFPSGPIWFLVALSCAKGAGFGMAWTFVLRKATAGVPSAEAQRIANAITTVQRLGYALGAAFIGIAGNALGFEHIASAQQAGSVARWLFVVCLPVAGMGLLAMTRFVRDTGGPT